MPGDTTTAVVVGASGALGSLVAQRLAERGASLVLVGRTRDRVEAVDVGDAAVRRLALDLRLPDNVRRVVDVAVEEFGHVDLVVNAAGVVAFGEVAELDDATVHHLLTVNMVAPITLAAAVLPHMADGGTIVNVSAVVAEQPMKGMAAYSASKAGLWAFDRAFAQEARRRGVRVLDARPPHTETGLADRPVAGSAPRLPEGLDPAAVVDRILQAVDDGERDLPAEAF